ncbi:MAG: NAD(+) synthase [Erysipelotrichaceae bacterium]|nr:NAD(+) synthase [Erysipelotrichaceae bacterium]MBQ5805347.1 NAD(+) synthase [Erysipelotrichaceae bacterium]
MKNVFDVKKEVEGIVEFIRDYYEKNHLKGVVIGISGGKDSGVVAALFSKALGKENVVGVTMPCHTPDSCRDDAKLVAEKYGFELINIDLTAAFDAFKEDFSKIGSVDPANLKNSDINLKPRLRMATNYYVAAYYSALKGGTYLVAGTSNKSELFVGYFTKGGDSTYDIGVLNDFNVEEVIRIGEYLEVPEKVLYKTPNDDLSSMTDEDKLGVKYSEIAAYMNGENVEDKARERIEKLHAGAAHKFHIPVYRRCA